MHYQEKVSIDEFSSTSIVVVVDDVVDLTLVKEMETPAHLPAVEYTDNVQRSTFNELIVTPATIHKIDNHIGLQPGAI